MELTKRMEFIISHI